MYKKHLSFFKYTIYDSSNNLNICSKIFHIIIYIIMS